MCKIFHTARFFTCPKSLSLSSPRFSSYNCVKYISPTGLPLGSRESPGNWLVCLCFQLMLYSSIVKYETFFHCCGGCVASFFFSPKKCWNENAKVQISHHVLQQTQVCSVLSLQRLFDFFSAELLNAFPQFCFLQILWRKVAVSCCLLVCSQLRFQISPCQILSKALGPSWMWFWQIAWLLLGSVSVFSVFCYRSKSWHFFLVNKLSQNFKVLTAPILTADFYCMKLKLLCLQNKNPSSQGFCVI